jgi:aerobic-type carbon monoxide dehydrogenase small subunit (CoxS/CutS family)
MTDRLDITVTINKHVHHETVPVRMLLTDFLRDQLGLTGTHVGCEHGVCGNCTIFVNGETVRACLMFAAQVDQCEVVTIEGFESKDGELNAVQQGFYEKHGLQCGFCTPGMLATVSELLEESPNPDEQEIRERISGVICRCTGYQSIVESTQRAAEIMQAAGQAPDGSATTAATPTH